MLQMKILKLLQWKCAREKDKETENLNNRLQKKEKKENPYSDLPHRVQPFRVIVGPEQKIYHFGIYRQPFVRIYACCSAAQIALSSSESACWKKPSNLHLPEQIIFSDLRPAPAWTFLPTSTGI